MVIHVPNPVNVFVMCDFNILILPIFSSRFNLIGPPCKGFRLSSYSKPFDNINKISSTLLPRQDAVDERDLAAAKIQAGFKVQIIKTT